MSTLGNTAVSPEKVATTTAGGHYTASAAGNMSENPGVEQSGEACENTVQNLNQSECREKTPGQPRKRKSISGSPISSTRLLRSRSKEKSGAPEANNTVVTHDAIEEKKRKRRKKKHSKDIAVNEFTRIRAHLRYLLHRIQYEQTLIEAYSGEGWKGQSLEKIKLEKELQRAKTHIFRYKLKIRDLFQRLDTLLAEGRLPASLFDNEGEIDSEDIFCAKCGSKDLLADNDIILCDGACERAFHQLCVEPPLLKEDIPPDDEGWLCPGCDCKVDCIDLLNDLQGTDLSVTDSWEKVYSKEAAAASGEKLDDISGLPSDDSEDDDYNPENPDVEKNDSEDESSSDESDFYSASEDLAEAPPKDDEILGLPSDDSEDDDFNPDDPDKEPAKTESSSSDFTSDSEDLGLIVDTNRLPGDEQGVSSPVDNSRPNSASQEEKANVGKAKRNSLKDELSYLTQSVSPLVSAKRHLERLDYKKLHDETYGNGSSDSSDDEDFEGGPSPKVRKIRNAKAAMASPSSTPADIKDQNGKWKGSGHTSDGGHSEKLKVGGVDTSESHSSGKRKTYGEAATKRLYESFKDNQYPDRDAKEKLGKELGLTAHQVSKWFENARHCRRHSSHWDSIMSQKVSKESPSSSQIIGEPLGTESKSILNDASCNGVEKFEPLKQCLNGEKSPAIDNSEGDLLIQESSGKESSKPKAKNDATIQGSDDTPPSKTSKKQNAKVDTMDSQNDDMTDQGSDDTPRNKTSKKPNAKVDTPNSQNVRRSSRLQKQG
ncbi:pathogenesis-related homeodomain protein [Lycium ferocissimum]|uniref:pathogenesis-related homeodomain protein n=1 Tax=Lycium ferocissimum TaxID=112874 RepID=UPI002816743E|nr:pathogenesis-related homeodomain protein [Lycium ferocissimum]XP_059313942.1 pathogenesis-related homeodomain protein [Lycium ferocissimum]XP_059313943.1 pathogenesis-related homeodomain protein [Lycium ferocissimum]XP_059313944.1 pathogenesis-related homeodomain protein [Lycium ferocissimum]